MLKNNSLTIGILILSYFATMAEASTINTTLSKGSGKILLVQFGTTPTDNQRQQDTFNRGLEHHQNSLRIQRQAEYNRQQNELARIERIRRAKESARESIPELERRGEYLALGRAWRTLEEWDKSLNAVEKAIVANPNVVNGYILRASLRKRLNDIPGALADYDKAIVLESDFHGYYQLRGELKKNFDRNGAIQDFRMAMKVIRTDNRYSLIRDRRINELAAELRSLGARE
jgi:tetratricopeptide (TPR) repeat protein